MPEFGWVICRLRDSVDRWVLVLFKPLNLHSYAGLLHKVGWPVEAVYSGRLKSMAATLATWRALIKLQQKRGRISL